MKCCINKVVNKKVKSKFGPKLTDEQSAAAISKWAQRRMQRAQDQLFIASESEEHPVEHDPEEDFIPSNRTSLDKDDMINFCLPLCRHDLMSAEKSSMKLIDSSDDEMIMFDENDSQPPSPRHGRKKRQHWMHEDEFIPDDDRHDWKGMSDDDYRAIIDINVCTQFFLFTFTLQIE